MTLTATGLYVGAADEPGLAVDHIYLRVDGLDGEPVYRYHDHSADPT